MWWFAWACVVVAVVLAVVDRVAKVFAGKISMVPVYDSWIPRAFKWHHVASWPFVFYPDENRFHLHTPRSPEVLDEIDGVSRYGLVVWWWMKYKVLMFGKKKNI